MKYLKDFTEVKPDGSVKVSTSGRNLSKYPFIKNVYGQGVKSMRNDIAAGMYDNILAAVIAAKNQEELDVVA
jgi:hypothetical protein